MPSEHPPHRPSSPAPGSGDGGMQEAVRVSQYLMHHHMQAHEETHVAQEARDLRSKLETVVGFAKSQEGDVQRLQEELRAREREVEGLKEELGQVKGLLRKNQQRSAVLLERLSGAVLGSHGAMG